MKSLTKLIFVLLIALAFSTGAVTAKPSLVVSLFSGEQHDEIIDTVRDNFNGGTVKMDTLQLMDGAGNKRYITATSQTCFDTEGEPVTCS